MGTNYYFIPESRVTVFPRPPKWNSESRFDVIRWHIGKSAGGWCFALHVHPDLGIESLDDWRALWNAGGRIINEYDDFVTTEEMDKFITERAAPGGPNRFDHPPSRMSGAETWDDFHRRNYSEFGPRGLLRARIDGVHVIAHGDGTWDLCIGDFS